MGKIVKDFLDMLCDFAKWLKNVLINNFSGKLEIVSLVQNKKSDAVVVERNKKYSYYWCEVTYKKNITFQIGVMLENIPAPKRELFVSFLAKDISGLFTQDSDLFNKKTVENDDAWFTVKKDVNKDFFDDASSDTNKENILRQILDAVVRELDKLSAP